MNIKTFKTKLLQSSRTIHKNTFIHKALCPLDNKATVHTDIFYFTKYFNKKSVLISTIIVFKNETYKQIKKKGFSFKKKKIALSTLNSAAQCCYSFFVILTCFGCRRKFSFIFRKTSISKYAIIYSCSKEDMYQPWLFNWVPLKMLIPNLSWPLNIFIFFSIHFTKYVKNIFLARKTNEYFQQTSLQS